MLLFHCEGCTPFTEVNDTHLHAYLARVLIQLENEWALEERQRLEANGPNKTPQLRREDIISLVQTAWLSINHANVAEKCYKQTGPTMQLRGPVSPEVVFGDLLRVLQENDPTSTPTEVGMWARGEAVAYVNEGWLAGKWTTWADCHKLIEEHTNADEALEEGLEAFGVEPEETDDEDGDNEDDDDCHDDYDVLSSGNDDEDGDDPSGGGDGPPANADDALEEDRLAANEIEDAAAPAAEARAGVAQAELRTWQSPIE